MSGATNGCVTGRHFEATEDFAKKVADSLAVGDSEKRPSESVLILTHRLDAIDRNLKNRIDSAEYHRQQLKSFERLIAIEQAEREDVTRAIAILSRESRA